MSNGGGRGGGYAGELRLGWATYSCLDVFVSQRSEKDADHPCIHIRQIPQGPSICNVFLYMYIVMSPSRNICLLQYGEIQTITSHLFS